MIYKFLQFIKQHRLLFLYLGSAVILFLFYCAHNYSEYPYDSGVYWQGGSIYGIDHFSLLNFDYPLRGYLLPLIFFIPQKLASITGASPHMFFWMIGSIVYAFTFVIAFPALIERIFQTKISLLMRVIFLIFTMIFFKGLILYPVSDLMSISFLVYSIYLFMLIIEQDIQDMLEQF